MMPASVISLEDAHFWGGLEGGTAQPSEACFPSLPPFHLSSRFISRNLAKYHEEAFTLLWLPQQVDVLGASVLNGLSLLWAPLC